MKLLLLFLFVGIAVAQNCTTSEKAKDFAAINGYYRGGTTFAIFYLTMICTPSRGNEFTERLNNINRDYTEFTQEKADKWEICVRPLPADTILAEVGSHIAPRVANEAIRIWQEQNENYVEQIVTFRPLLYSDRVWGCVSQCAFIAGLGCIVFLMREMSSGPTSDPEDEEDDDVGIVKIFDHMPAIISAPAL